MILEVLGDLFAVPLLPTPTPEATPEPPNSAEVESARAAWESARIAWWGVAASALGSLFAGVAALVAGVTLRHQAAELKRERIERRDEQMKRAEYQANRVAIAGGATASSVSISGYHSYASRLRLTVVNASDERIRDVRLAPGAEILQAHLQGPARGRAGYEVAGRQVLLGSIPPGGELDIEVFLADEGDRARGHISGNFGVALLWSDPSYNHWWLDDKHGLNGIQDNELEVWPED